MSSTPRWEDAHGMPSIPMEEESTKGEVQLQNTDKCWRIRRLPTTIAISLLYFFRQRDAPWRRSLLDGNARTEEEMPLLPQSLPVTPLTFAGVHHCFVQQQLRLGK